MPPCISRPRGGSVPADSAQKVPGQDYSRVRDPQPRDPSGIRSKYHKHRKADRKYLEQMMRRNPDLDHQRRIRDMDGDV